jgi:hypothetical protein
VVVVVVAHVTNVGGGTRRRLQVLHTLDIFARVGGLLLRLA